MRLPGTKRTARAPDGRRWRVGRRWTTTHRTALRQRRTRDRDHSWQPGDAGQRNGEDGGALDWSSGGDTGGGFGVGDLLDGDSLAVGFVLVVVLALLALLVFPLIEVIVVAVLIAGGVASRVVLRRPWRVEARLLDGDRPRRRAHWEVVGFRRSGAVARQVAEHLAATGELPPRDLAALPERT